MKFLFLNLLCITSAMAGRIVVQFEDHKDLALLTKNILIAQHGVPNKLVELKAVKKCGLLELRSLNFCVNKKRELSELPNIKNKSIKKSLLIFKRLKND